MDKLGLEKPAASFLTSADPKEVYWLNGDLAAGFHIDFEVVDKKPTDRSSTASISSEPARSPSKPDILSIPDTKPGHEIAEPKVRSEPKKTQPKPQPQRRAGTAPRTCGISIPVPYIGGITLRGRC
jgi:hypothetical protein